MAQLTQPIILPQPLIKKNVIQRKGPKLDVSIDPGLFDLVRLRIAQIHRYRFGVVKSWLRLKARGENEELLDQLKVWRQSPFFSDKEKAALTLSEAISADAQRTILNSFLDEARRHFKREELISLLMAIMAAVDPNHPASQDETEENFPASPSEPSEPAQTQSLPLPWLRFAHRLSEMGIIIK